MRVRGVFKDREGYRPWRILSLGAEIVNGTFDKYLLRPVSPFIQFVGGEIQYVGLCVTLLGVLLLTAGLSVAQARRAW